jgi:Holliday junction resolvase RusA-like endonuclease
MSRALLAKTFGKTRAGSSRQVAVVTQGRFSVDNDARREAERIEIFIPTPPSSNSLYANSENGGRFKTKEYTDWLDEAGWRLQEQRPGRIAGRYVIEIEIPRAADNRRRDLGNREKAVSDLLVRQRVIADDNLAERIVSVWGPVGSEAKVTLTRWAVAA